MKTLLQINTSMFGNGGQSTRLADEFVATWRAHHPAERFGAFLAKPDERDAGQEAVVRYSDALIDELQRADVIVLGLPMYNFGVPSTLKAYFDHIARVGEAFKYTEKGPVGLLTGKKVYVFAARGGMYAGTPNDTQTPFIRTFLSFIGMSDIEFVYAEGLAISEASKQQSLARAEAAIDALAEPELAAA